MKKITPLQLTRDEATGIEKKLVSHLPQRKGRQPEQNLYIDVIMQAVRDLRKDDERMRSDAQGFLAGTVGDIQSICHVADIDHGYIKRVINTVHANRAQDDSVGVAA